MRFNDEKKELIRRTTWIKRKIMVSKIRVLKLSCNKMSEIVIIKTVKSNFNKK